MVAIDAEIDQRPTKSKIRDLVENKNRNLQAFQELRHFNDTGEFLYKHPLIIHYSLRSELMALMRRNPEEFLEQFANARDNVKRYTSFLKSKSRSAEQKAKDKENLKKHESRIKIFQEVMQPETT